MIRRSECENTDEPEEPPSVSLGPNEVLWIARQFEQLFEEIKALEAAVDQLVEGGAAERPRAERGYYSVPEFAERVGRNEYTVREWCRLGRVHAEKRETGRGDAREWKIPVDELARYQDHGLLPLNYYR